MEATSLESKQEFLRKEIIEGGIDPELFMDYMGRVKNEGSNIELEAWTMEEIRDVVGSFKMQREAEKEMLKASRSKDFRRSKIFDVPTKVKVQYEDGLWDYEVREEQECGKLTPFFTLAEGQTSFIKIEKSEIKSVGGFLFGFGSRNELEMLITSNIGAEKIVRRGEDCDWLKKMLTHKYIGCYVPPLTPDREMSAQDEKGISLRVAEIERFLNSLLKYPVFQSSNYFKAFMTIIDTKKFHEYKIREESFAIEKDIDNIESVTGRLMVDISQQMTKTIKFSSGIATEFSQLYLELETALDNVLISMDKLHSNVKKVSEISIKLGEKYNQTQTLLGSEDLKISEMMLSLNNTVAIVNKNIKRHSQALKRFSTSYIKPASKDWTEFVLNSKRVTLEHKNYLTFKDTLLKKKEKHYDNPTRWELPEAEYREILKKRVGSMTKEECFRQMFPNDNETENRLRIWVAFVHQSYLGAYRIFIKEQERELLDCFLGYSAETLCLNEEVRNCYGGFQEIAAK